MRRLRGRSRPHPLESGGLYRLGRRHRGARIVTVAVERMVHYESAGLLTQAVEHPKRCVGRAQQRGAQRQAAAYVEHALRLLEGLPAGADRPRRELALRLLLGVSLNVTHGYVVTIGVEV